MKTNARLLAIVGAATLNPVATSASADTVSVHGKVIVTQGHISPGCRMVEVRRTDTGAYVWFRIAGTGQEDGILATTLTAVATGLDVDVYYDPEVTSGCGTEPQITWINLRAPTAP